MNKTLVYILLILCLVSSGQDGTPGGIPPKKAMHVFILMGQSNMSGYGEILPADTIPVEDVFLIPTVSDKPFEWRPAAHPLHNRLKSDRFGLGLPFAIEYLKTHPGVQVGLIPVAWGGAAIDQLNKGTVTYADALAKAKFAYNSGCLIKGILWHQGESDTVDEKLAESYQEKLIKLIDDLRSDLGNVRLPFIAGNLAEFYGTGKDHNAPDRVKRISVVKNALREIPGKRQFTGFVESTGCSSIDQHQVHFDRRSYIILGKRYAEKYDEITAE